jgi:hypothetical protein
MPNKGSKHDNKQIGKSWGSYWHYDLAFFHIFPLIDIRGTKRRFNRSWLEKYQWLRYSESENGVFCLCCVLFNSSEHAFVTYDVIICLCFGAAECTTTFAFSWQTCTRTMWKLHTWVFYWLFLPLLHISPAFICIVFNTNLELYIYI